MKILCRQLHLLLAGEGVAPARLFELRGRPLSPGMVPTPSKALQTCQLCKH